MWITGGPTRISGDVKGSAVIQNVATTAVVHRLVVVGHDMRVQVVWDLGRLKMVLVKDDTQMERSTMEVIVVVVTKGQNILYRVEVVLDIMMVAMRERGESNLLRE
jgi:hypothetical protein